MSWILYSRVYLAQTIFRRLRWFLPRMWVYISMGLCFSSNPVPPHSSLCLYCPIKNKPQWIRDGKQYSTSPKSYFSCLVTQTLHGKPSANRTACEEQKQEEIFRYPTPIITTIPRPALAINSTAFRFIPSSTEPPGKDFVKSVNHCNEDIPTEKYLPKSKTGKYHPVCCTIELTFRSSEMRSSHACLPIAGDTCNRNLLWVLVLVLLWWEQSTRLLDQDL